MQMSGRQECAGAEQLCASVNVMDGETPAGTQQYANRRPLSDLPTCSTYNTINYMLYGDNSEFPSFV
jgi:hypothetical protein